MSRKSKVVRAPKGDSSSAKRPVLAQGHPGENAQPGGGADRKGQKEDNGKGRKAAKQATPKRVSALDAAAQVLAKSEVPMRAKELIAAMEKAGLWHSPSGKTPHATLYAAMIREIAALGDRARFKKLERGVFVATGHAARVAKEGA